MARRRRRCAPWRRRRSDSQERLRQHRERIQANDRSADRHRSRRDDNRYGLPDIDDLLPDSTPERPCLPNKSGEPITIIAIEFDQDVTNTVAKAVTDASGNWSTLVKPLVETIYTAQTSTSKSQAVKVTVHPRVGFGISGNNFSAKITGRDTFAGAVALFQVQTNTGWRTRAVIVVNTFSVARFHVNLKRGHTYTVRIYLPQRQAGPGYLDGSSHIRRVGGNS